MSKFEDTRFYRYTHKWIGSFGCPGILLLIGLIVWACVAAVMYLIEAVRWISNL